MALLGKFPIKRHRTDEDLKELRGVANIGQSLLDKQVNREERLKYTPRFVLVCILWLLFVATVIVLQGFGYEGFHLEASVLVALVAGTSVSVISFVAVIIKYLFSSNEHK